MSLLSKMEIIAPVVLLSFLTRYVCCDLIPVVAWTPSSSCSNNSNFASFTQLKSSELGNIVMKIIEAQYMIIIFVEDTLMVEDFIPINGQHNFHHLQDIGTRHKMVYFPSIRDPLEFLKTLSAVNSVRTHNISGYIDDEKCDEDMVLKVKNGMINIEEIYLGKESSNESRSALLKKHDKMITDLCECVENFKKTFCIFTGLNGFKEENFQKEHENNLMIKMLEDENSRFENGIDTKLQHCEKECIYSENVENASVIVYLDEPPSLTYKDQTFSMKNYESSVERVDDSILSLRIACDSASLLFNFTSLSSRAWKLTNIAVEFEKKVIPLKGDVQIKASTGQSVVCKRSVFLGEDTRLSFSNMKIQPSFMKSNISIDDYVLCVPFQSIAVFMAYISTCTMILILSWGFGMISVIGANSSFDGPQQKILIHEL